MFIIKDQPPCGPDCSPACSCGRFLEIWNDVFMQYNKTADGQYVPMAKKNVDTGMGLERTVCTLNGCKTVYETDAVHEHHRARFPSCPASTMTTTRRPPSAFRIVADHLRTSTFIMGDPRGVSPSNVDQGYVLRRLIRRAVRFGMELGMPEGFTAEIGKVVINQYAEVYPELKQNESVRAGAVQAGGDSLSPARCSQGEREFEKAVSRMGENKVIDGVVAFNLYDDLRLPD